MRSAVVGQGTGGDQDAGKEAWGMTWRTGNERQETNGRREDEGSRVRYLQNQSEGHGERLIFPFLICQSPAAWRLRGPGEEEMGQEWSKSWRPRP